MALCDKKTTLEIDDRILKLMQTSVDLYTLKNRIAYLLAVVDFLKAKTKRQTFKKPELKATFLDRVFLQAIKYVQKQCFGPALVTLRSDSNHYDPFLERFCNLAVNAEQTRQVDELKTLHNLRPYIAPDLPVRVEGRLENTDLSTDTKHPIILPSRHALTHLVIYKYSDAVHAGPRIHL